MKLSVSRLAALSVFVLCAIARVASQDIKFERDRHRTMLNEIKNDIKKNYFDPTFRGFDLDAKAKLSEEKIKQAATIGQMSGVVAQYMLDFDDSHLFFLPPGKANKTDYGFDMQMIGERCYIIRLDPNSDAAKKGLQIGDQVLALDGITPSRGILWKMDYMFKVLRPRLGLNLVILTVDGKEKPLAIASRVIQGKRVLDATGGDLDQIMRDDETAYQKAVRQYYFDKIPGLFVWKMPSFSLEPSKVDDIIGKAKQSDLIIDLRDNGGGRIDMLLRLIGNLFPADVKVCDEKGRKETKEIIAKSRKKDAFTGRVVVLIDSGSASASEIVAKVIQLENRGVVIGDISAGAVMESRRFGHSVGMDVVAFYGSSVTIADLIMKDGKSLEKTGVIPNERLLPTARDLATGRDVVLSRAVELLGFKLSAEEAGKIFPNEYEHR